MSRWFSLVLLAALAVALGLLASRPWGNVLIVLPPWRVEMGIGLAVVAVLLTFVLLYGVLRLLAWFAGLSGRVRGWQRERSRQQRHEASLLARLDQLQGKHESAARQFEALADAARAEDARAAVLEQLSALSSWRALARYDACTAGLERARELAGSDAELHGLIDQLTAVLLPNTDEKGTAPEPAPIIPGDSSTNPPRDPS
jgi:HemY protein